MGRSATGGKKEYLTRTNRFRGSRTTALQLNVCIRLQPAGVLVFVYVLLCEYVIILFNHMFQKVICAAFVMVDVRGKQAFLLFFCVSLFIGVLI